MRALTIRLFAPALLAGCALASDLDLRLESGGQTLVVVDPGASVDWQVIGELDDAANEGLALFALDFAFSGGALAPADAPSAGPMLNFDRPLGFTNPAGFGGTLVGGDLIQVGGGQNTIKNAFASLPTGSVQTGVAQPGAAVILASGSLNAPAQTGTYVLRVTDGFVNVIRQGEDGSGEFWAVEPAGLGVTSDLTVIVLDCSAASYCEPKPSSAGCSPEIGSSGSPSLSGADDFHVTAGEVLNRQFGALVWSLAADEAPFKGGTLCVSAPFSRMGLMSTRGNLGAIDCSGGLDQHLSQAAMVQLGWTPGTVVFTQFLYRDPFHSDGSGFGMTDGLAFTVCP